MNRRLFKIKICLAMNKLLAVSKDENMRKQAEEIILHIRGSEAFEEMMQKSER